MASLKNCRIKISNCKFNIVQERGLALSFTSEWLFVHFKGDRFQYYMMLLNIGRILIVQERRNQLRAELIQQEIASTRIRQGV